MYFGPGDYYEKVFDGSAADSNLLQQNSDGSYNVYSVWFGVNQTTKDTRSTDQIMVGENFFQILGYEG